MDWKFCRLHSLAEGRAGKAGEKKSPETCSICTPKETFSREGQMVFLLLRDSCFKSQLCLSMSLCQWGLSKHESTHTLARSTHMGSGVTHYKCYREDDSGHVELNLDQCLRRTCPRGWQNSKIYALSCHSNINVSYNAPINHRFVCLMTWIQ